MSSVEVKTVPQEGDGVIIYISGGDHVVTKIRSIDGETVLLRDLQMEKQDVWYLKKM